MDGFEFVAGCDWIFLAFLVAIGENGAGFVDLRAVSMTNLVFNDLFNVLFYRFQKLIMSLLNL